MKLFKIFWVCIVFVLLVLLMGSGCNALMREDFEFLQEDSEIQSIQIIKIGEMERVNDALIPNFDIMCTIEDTEQFLKDFLAVKCYSRFSDPNRPLPGCVGVKITYNNGDYEIICNSGQSNCVDGVYDPDRGYHSFDDIQFEKLIKKYVDVTNENSIA